MSQRFVTLSALFAIAAATLSASSQAATFTFGKSKNNFDGLSAKTLTSGGFNLQLTAAAAGTLLNEPQDNGMGIDSRPIAGSDDPTPAVFNIVRSTGPAAGTHEALHFAFNKPGVITGLNFDGVKDELLEYFTLQTVGGSKIHFFDSAANTTVPGAVDSAIQANALVGQVIYLLEINSLIDDEAQGLRIPFGTGDQFSLTINELGPQFGALGDSNGARLQGITVVAVPEPASVILVALGGGLAMICWIITRKNGHECPSSYSDNRTQQQRAE